MENVFYPTLKTISVLIDPATMTEYTFTNPRSFFLLDLQAPEVSTVKLGPIARANLTCYERAINKYFTGNFQYNTTQLWPAEKRTIKFLNNLAGVINPDGKFLLNIVILEW